MATTVKRLNLSLTKEDVKELEFLTKHLGQTNAQVIRRAISLLYYLAAQSELKEIPKEELK